MPWISFTGKTFVQNHHLNVKFHELIPNAANSLSAPVSLNDNLIIEGDNLKGLKALLPTYGGIVISHERATMYKVGKKIKYILTLFTREKVKIKAIIRKSMC